MYGVEVDEECLVSLHATHLSTLAEQVQMAQTSGAREGTRRLCPYPSVSSAYLR